MASLFVYPSATPVASGNSYASSKLYFYRPGTTTLITVYSTSALDPLAVLTNPVVASATGVFAPIWIDESTNPSYRVIHKTSANATISDKDNISVAITAASIGAALYPISDAETSAGLDVGDLTRTYPYGDIRRYGAATTNTGSINSAAIQSAIDQAEAGGAGVFIPSGTFPITSLTVDVASGITVYGEGYTSCLQAANAGTALPLLIQRTGNTALTGMRLTNFRIDANSGGQLDAGVIQMNGCVGFVVDRIWIENGTRTSGASGVNGIACSAGAAAAVGSLGSITNCYIRNCSKAGINWTSESLSGYIAGNIIRDCTGNGSTPGIQVNGGFNGRVIGNYITNTQGPGIYCATDGAGNPSRNTVISGNVLQACGASSTSLNDGILIANASGVNVGRYVVANNQCYDNGNGANGGSGIHVQNDSNIVISGNLCRNNKYDGIRIDTCKHVAVSGNRCTGNNVGAATYAGGIQIRGTCAHISATANHCADDKDTPTQSYGIVLDASATLTYLTISDNHLEGNVNGPLFAGVVAKPGYIRFVGELQTANATATNVVYFTLPDDCAAAVVAKLLGTKSDGSARAMYTKEALIYRDGGSATVQGSATTLGTDLESDGTWGGLTIDANTNSIRVRATGLADTTINWRCPIELTVM